MINKTSQLAALIRTTSYPAVLAASAAAIFGGLAAGWPYLPTVPLVAAVALAIVALLERLLPFQQAWLEDHHDTKCDATHAVVNLAVLLAVHAVIAALAPYLSPGRFWPTQLPLWAQALAAGAILDLSLYAVHWFSHRSRWLWKFHAIHHSAERLYWLNGERRHPLHAGMMAGPGLAVLVILGAPAAAIGAWLGVLAVHLAFQHSNLDYRLGPLKFVLAVAEVHRWHHKREYEDAQVNYGEFWLVWDHLFRTFKLPATELGPREVGLKESDFPISYGAQLAYPFRRTPAASHSYESARGAFAREVSTAVAHRSRGDVAGAWRAYELAHVISQPYLLLHLRSHAAMLRYAILVGNWREAGAQTLRFIVAPLGHLLGKTPPNNVGTGRVGLTDPGEWPLELNRATLERR